MVKIRSLFHGFHFSPFLVLPLSLKTSAKKVSFVDFRCAIMCHVKRTFAKTAACVERQVLMASIGVKSRCFTNFVWLPKRAPSCEKGDVAGLRLIRKACLAPAAIVTPLMASSLLFEVRANRIHRPQINCNEQNQVGANNITEG